MLGGGARTRPECPSALAATALGSALGVVLLAWLGASLPALTVAGALYLAAERVRPTTGFVRPSGGPVGSGA